MFLFLFIYFILLRVGMFSASYWLYCDSYRLNSTFGVLSVLIEILIHA